LGAFYAGLSDELSLYARRYAWLHAVPRIEKKDDDDFAEDPVSRYQEMEEAGIDPEMPDLSVPHLFQYLMEAGPFETGMERAPLSWRELAEWQRNTGVVLQPWETKLIRRASAEYLSELTRAEKPDCLPPWGDEVAEQDHAELLDRKLDAMFAGLAAR
jgi:hypothetical protein